MSDSEQIQHIVQIDFLPDLELVFRLCQVIEQKLQHQRAAQPAALDLEMVKPHGQIGMHDVADADEAGILHGPGKAVALSGVRRCAAVLGAVLAQHLPADRLIALSPVPASKPAAFVAQELHLRLLPVGQRAEPAKRPVQAEIRHHIPECLAAQLPLKVHKVREHLGGGGDEVQPRIGFPEIVQQQLRMDNHAVLRLAVLLQQSTERVAPGVGKVLLAQQGVTERQPGRNTVVPRQGEGRLRIAGFRSDAAAAPDALRRRAIEGADFAPVVEVFPVVAVQRQEGGIQVVKRKQAGEVVAGDARLWGHEVGVFGHDNHPESQHDGAVSTKGVSGALHAAGEGGCHRGQCDAIPVVFACKPFLAQC